MLFGLVATVAVLGGLLWLGFFGQYSPSRPIISDTGSMIEQASETKDQLEQRAVLAQEAVLGTVESTPKEQQENGNTGFEPLYPVTIGTVAVRASLATTTVDRTRGLSGTSALPEGVVKLFVFDGPGHRGIWMKDMQYPIDIIWLDAGGVVIYFEQRVSPQTYPTVFASPNPATYVIEAAAGFVVREGIQIGDRVVLPPQAVADV